MARVKGAVRRSQLVTTYGVGSIVAVEDESFMVAGIDRWDVGEPNLHEPRLERKLGVKGFVVPPATDKGQDIPVIRFPRMQSCPTCRRLADHRHFTGFDQNKCGDCGTVLVPSRFVIACSRGHIDEFPYSRWVHRGNAPEGSHSLFINSQGATASLRDIVISCSCGAERTMDGAFDRFALKNVASCLGKRPWLGRESAEPCDQPVRALQRGGSSVWFASPRSAISIPPWSEGAYQALNKRWDILRVMPEGALEPTIRELGLADGTSFSVDDLVQAVKQRKAGDEKPFEGSEQDIREQEYEALVRGREETSRRQEFVATEADVPPALADWIQRVMLVPKLREVRVLQGFSRILPPRPGEPDEHIAPLYATAPGWLPGIEVKGEGIFLELNRSKLEKWEARSDVTARAARINAHYANRAAGWGVEPDREITPRLLAIHTLAHALIDQFALDAGYPAASLRERLFVSDHMCGVLIYTATTDSAGSLGGVIAQATGDRLSVVMDEAMKRYAWCSSDPLCVESEGQGTGSLNLAACHACALLPETSCEEMNSLLDRGLLIGTPTSPDLGFFSDFGAV